MDLNHCDYAYSSYVKQGLWFLTDVVLGRNELHVGPENMN